MYSGCALNSESFRITRDRMHPAHPISQTGEPRQQPSFDADRCCFTCGPRARPRVTPAANLFKLEVRIEPGANANHHLAGWVRSFRHFALSVRQEGYVLPEQ